MSTLAPLVLLTAALLLAPAAAADGTREVVLTDFTRDGPSMRWFTVNDNVMGGRSSGDFRVADGRLVFSGSTNTRGGGFSSIRTRPQALGLRDMEGIVLRVRGDGRRYTFQLRTSTTRQMARSPSYRADFQTAEGNAWQEIRIPFSAFRPTWRGMALRGPALDRAHIDAIGLMIYDKRDGPFELEVDRVEAYARPTPPAADGDGDTGGSRDRAS